MIDATWRTWRISCGHLCDREDMNLVHDGIITPWSHTLPMSKSELMGDKFGHFTCIKSRQSLYVKMNILSALSLSGHERHVP